MPHHMLRIGTANSFMAHRLDGWDPVHDNVRYPVSFTVNREGDNLGLYLAPVGLTGLRDALALPADDTALVLDSQDGPGVLRWGDIDMLGGEVDIVHLPRGVDAWQAERQLPSALLAQPEQAVPTDLGGRVAISLHDGCHGTVLSPDTALLARCLRGFLDDYQVAVLGRDAELPAITGDLIEPFLEPQSPGTWWGLCLRPGCRFWVLDMVRHDDEGQSDSVRWVSEGENGRWRPGWSW